MARCPSCEYPLPENRDRVGARCPSCRDPLYEPPGRFARAVRPGQAACVLHAGNESIGSCSRCGSALCEICRTKWRDQVLCAACIERALGSNEATPEQAQAVFRQALSALLLGIGAWVLAVLAFLLFFVIAPSSEHTYFLFAVFVLGLVAAAPAVFSIGQSVAVLRIRSNHALMATIGLTLSGLYVGVVIGVFMLGVWQA